MFLDVSTRQNAMWSILSLFAFPSPTSGEIRYQFLKTNDCDKSGLIQTSNSPVKSMIADHCATLVPNKRI